MAKKKSFEEKERAFLEKNKTKFPTQESGGYTPPKTKRDEAYELLEKKGFSVSYKDFVLFCECSSEEEYERYVDILKSNFGKNGKVPFSYGANICKVQSEE